MLCLLVSIRVPAVSRRRRHPGPVCTQRLRETRPASASSHRLAPLPPDPPSGREPSVCHRSVCRVPEGAGRPGTGAQHRTGLWTRTIKPNPPKVFLTREEFITWKCFIFLPGSTWNFSPGDFIYKKFWRIESFLFVSGLCANRFLEFSKSLHWSVINLFLFLHI